MHVVGIIAEYNPFHNGHLYHLRTAKERCSARYAVCVMSGNFLQRGEPALFDKWARAAMAVSAGADVVFELPFVFACRSAGVFARGGVELLASTGIVTHLCFGSENGSLEQLRGIAALLTEESPVFQSLLREKLQCGVSYPAARHLALQQYCRLLDLPGLSCDMDLLAYPNNTLGIEYLIALAKVGCDIIPITIKRRSANYLDKTVDGPIASATAIRHLFASKGLTEEIKLAVPAPAASIMTDCMRGLRGPVWESAFGLMLLSLLRRTPSEELALILDVSEGLEYKLKEAANTASSTESLLTALKSKRYTRTRLQRILMYCLLNYKKETAQAFNQCGPQYLRVLAFSEKGRELLKLMKKSAKLPIIHRPAEYVSTACAPATGLEEMLAFDILATDLYVLGCPQPQRGGLDYLTSAVRVN